MEWKGKQGAILPFSDFVFIHVSSFTGLLQVWPTLENVTVNGSLPWDEITRVGSFDGLERISYIRIDISDYDSKKYYSLPTVP